MFLQIFGSEIPDIRSFSLREKVAQMIMVRVRGEFYNSENWYKKKLKKWIKEDGIGGVITFGGSIHGTYHNNKMFQSWSNHPLLISADYERGVGQWLSSSTLFPSNMAFAATNNSNYAYEAGKIIAKEATAMGVHIILGPVLDVNNNPKNPIINFRSYSDMPSIVSEFGLNFIKGVQDAGRIACSKHFPGHGNTAVDSHTSLPTISGTREVLEKVELYPFKKAVENNVGAVMTAHISVPGLDKNNNPASHSWKISTKILKNEWGFKGLVITDGMEMGGLTQSAWAGESAILAIEAGADILLLPLDVEKTIDKIVSAVLNGRISENRINESVIKILRNKNSMGLFQNRIPTWELVENTVGLSKNKAFAQKIANESITLVKDENNLLPIKQEKIQRFTHLVISTDEDVKSKLKLFIKDINHTHGNVNEIIINQKLNDHQIDGYINDLKNAQNPILVSALVRIRMDKGEATIDSTHDRLLRKLNQNSIPFVLASFGSPYLINYSHIPTYICGYGYGSVTMKAMANAIWGRIKINGKLPVKLDETLIYGTGLKREKRKSGFSENLNIDFENLENIIQNLINNKVFPSAQLFVAKDHDILLNKGYGSFTYDIQSQTVNKNSIYDIASLTKIVSTTPLVMKLISQKKISLNHKVKQFFPNFEGTYKDQITIKDLLTHTSGINSYYEYFMDSPVKSYNEIINDIISQELISIPNKEVNYSDLGFLLLGGIINEVQKLSLNELTQRYIINPLDMKNTLFNPPEQLIKDIVPTEVDSRFRGKLIQGIVHDENAYIIGGISTHAGLFSTAEDIGKYTQMLLNGGTWLGERLFEKSIIDEFTEKQKLIHNSDRAIGFDTPSQNGQSSAGDYFSENSFGHLGFTGTSVWADKDKNILIVLLTNRVYPSRKNKAIYQARRKIYNTIMQTILNG